MNRLFTLLIAAVLILIAAFYCAGQPRPSVEAFPPTPYVAPPSPPERAAARAHAQSNLAARAEHRAAVSALAARLGAPAGTDPAALHNRALIFADFAAATDPASKLDSRAAAALALTTALAGYLAGKKKG